MGSQSHLMRRGRVFYWRRKTRRFSTGICDLQVSLRTTDRCWAGKIARQLSAESDMLMDAVAQDRISSSEAILYLKAVAVRELDRLVRVQTVTKASDTTSDPADRERQDWAYRKAFELMARHGVQVVLSPSIKEALIAEGCKPADIDTLDFVLDLNRSIVTGEADTLKRASEFQRVTGRAITGAFERMQLLDLHLEARANASARMEVAAVRRLASEVLTDDFAHASCFSTDGVTGQKATSVPLLAAAPQAVSENAVEAPEGPKFDPAIDNVVERMIDLKRGDETGLEEKTANQYRSFASLLQRVTGKTDVRDLRQADCAHFRDILLLLPKSFGKSPKDKTDTMPAIIERAKGLPKEKVGLSIPTRNRYIDHFSALVRAAQNEGFALDPSLKPWSLRRRETQRARDKKRSFKLDELRQLFRHPFWMPDDPVSPLRQPYSQRRKSGNYWVPIICAYTGMRREEIAGFSPEHFREENGIWYFEIAGTEARRLKNAASERRIPLHRDLHALGLRDFIQGAQKRGQSLLFPDLREPASSILGRKVGRHMEAIIPGIWGEQGEGLSLQSMRHYVQNLLDNDNEVGEKLARDIMGHEGKDVHSRNYGDPSPLPLLKFAIDRLPSVFPPELLNGG